MAVALLTTLWPCLANLFYSAQIERNVNAQTFMLSYSTAHLLRVKKARRLEMLLNTLLPPSERVDFFNKYEEL